MCPEHLRRADRFWSLVCSTFRRTHASSIIWPTSKINTKNALEIVQYKRLSYFRIIGSLPYLKQCWTPCVFTMLAQYRLEIYHLTQWQTLISGITYGRTLAILILPKTLTEIWPLIFNIFSIEFTIRNRIYMQTFSIVSLVYMNTVDKMIN